MAETGQAAGSPPNPAAIERAVRRIIDRGTACAAFVALDEAGAGAASLPVVREIAELGLRVLLLDLTVSGAVSRAMLDTVSLPGITDLLADAAGLGDVVHADRGSTCHVIPVGTVDPALAMRSAARLAEILQSLVAAHDVVVVECGPASLRGLRWLGSGDIDMFVSLAGASGPMDGKRLSAIRHGFPDAAVVRV